MISKEQTKPESPDKKKVLTGTIQRLDQTTAQRDSYKTQLDRIRQTRHYLDKVDLKGQEAQPMADVQAWLSILKDHTKRICNDTEKAATELKKAVDQLKKEAGENDDSNKN